MSGAVGLGEGRPVSRLSTQLLLRPQDVPASREDLEVVGAFNPGVIHAGGEVVMLVRIAEQPRERRPGMTGLPRWTADGEVAVDWVADAKLDPIDARVVRQKSDGRLRLTFTSHLRTVHCGNGKSVRALSGPSLIPVVRAEEYGIEDPRITPLGDRFYITYVAVSRHGPATMLASTSDFHTFERHGVIFCPENKDVLLFPEKIDGRFAAIHRPVGGSHFTRPEMWLARSHDLIHWGEHAPLALSSRDWQSGRVGGGAPPIRVRDGWLLIYHGNRHPSEPGDIGAYCGGAVLLDHDDPLQVLKQSTLPFLTPQADFETDGFVSNVVFPTGTIRDGSSLLVYYGAADTCTGVVEFNEQDLLESMTVAEAP